MCEEELDGSAGVLFPFFDPDTHLLYLAGKVRAPPTNRQLPGVRRRVSVLVCLPQGDGSVRCYQLSRCKPHIRFLSECRSALPHKGLGETPGTPGTPGHRGGTRLSDRPSLPAGVMPKRGLDVSNCEVFRFYRLIAVKDLVEPLSMIVPRKEVRVQGRISEDNRTPAGVREDASSPLQEASSGPSLTSRCSPGGR